MAYVGMVVAILAASGLALAFLASEMYEAYRACRRERRERAERFNREAGKYLRRQK